MYSVQAYSSSAIETEIKLMSQYEHDFDFV